MLLAGWGMVKHFLILFIKTGIIAESKLSSHKTGRFTSGDFVVGGNQPLF